MRINMTKLGAALTWLAVAALLLTTFGAVPVAANNGDTDIYTTVVATQESLPAKITVEDLGNQVKWSIDMDETDPDFANGHAAYGLVIGWGSDQQYQIHSNDGSDSTYAWGTHLYSAYDSTSGGYCGWHTGDTNTPVSDLDWVDATGERDLTVNTEAKFTVTIDKDHLNGGEFKWALALMGDTSDTRTPEDFGWCDGDTSNFHSHVAVGATPFAYDADIPRGASGAPSGWGDSSWQGPASGGTTGKSNYHVWYTDVTYGGAVDLEDLFGAAHGLTVADLESISFHTKKATSIPADHDWWVTIYTKLEDDGDDSGSWYDSRLHARPDVGTGYSQSYTSDAWNLWSTDAEASATNQLVFYDRPRGYGGYYETLANLAAGPVDWDDDNTDDHDYSGEEIKSITLQTDSGWNGFDGYIDGLTIELQNGSIGQVNLIDENTMGLEIADPGWLATCEDETITVDVLLTANGFNGVEFDLDFDETKLEATGVSMGSMWPSGATNPQHTVDNTNGVVEFAAYLQEADTNISVTDGQVAQITFKERDTSGDFTLDINDVIVSNSEGQSLDVSLEDGTLEVKGCGCVNGVVELQGRFGPDWDGAEVSLSGGPGGTYTYGPVTTNSDGEWDICDAEEVVEGDYDIAVVMYRYLDAEKTGVTVTDGGNTDVGQVKLLGGDCNDTGTGGNPNPAGAGYIDAGDASIVAGQFGVSTITDVRADINDDAVVNILDCSLLGGNWHKSGPISW